MPWWGWLLVGVGAIAVLIAAAGLALRRAQVGLRSDPLARRIVALPARAKVRLLWRLCRDRRVPLWAKALLPGVALYLVMPIDLIPDFIPIVGYVDDLLLLLLVAWLLLRAVPRDVIEDNVAALESGENSTPTAAGRGR